eukprot:scaffold405_cov243-Pinguiococcus_pyrenoidosus.AAC.5
MAEKANEGDETHAPVETLATLAENRHPCRKYGALPCITKAVEEAGAGAVDELKDALREVDRVPIRGLDDADQGDALLLLLHATEGQVPQLLAGS